MQVIYDRILNKLREASDGNSTFYQVSGFGDNGNPYDLIVRAIEPLQGYSASIRIVGQNEGGDQETLSFQCNLFMNYIDSGEGFAEIQNSNFIVSSLNSG